MARHEGYERFRHTILAAGARPLASAEDGAGGGTVTWWRRADAHMFIVHEYAGGHGFDVYAPHPGMTIDGAIEFFLNHGKEPVDFANLRARIGTFIEKCEDEGYTDTGELLELFYELGSFLNRPGGGLRR